MRASVLIVLIASGCATLPPVFSAREIERATEGGRTYRFRVETGDVTRIERLQFPESACRFRARIEGAEGDDEEVECTWSELAGHAAFPRARTTREEVSVTVPAGTFEAILVHVVDEDEQRVRNFWFAKALPGAPVKFEVIEHGELTYVSQLLEHTQP